MTSFIHIIPDFGRIVCSKTSRVSSKQGEVVSKVNLEKENTKLQRD